MNRQIGTCMDGETKSTPEMDRHRHRQERNCMQKRIMISCCK